MARITSVYLISVLFWLCLGEVYREEPASYRGPERHSNNVYASLQNWMTLNSVREFDLELRDLPSPVTNECSVGRWYTAAIPEGFKPDRPDDIKFSFLLDEEEQSTEAQCFQECCTLGPSRCQYVWFYKSTCVAVACQLYSNSGSCRPVHVNNLPSDVSSYVSMIYNSIDNTLPSSSPLPPSTLAPTTVTTTSHQYNNIPPRPTITPSDAVIYDDSEITLTAGESVTYPSQRILEYDWEVILINPDMKNKEMIMSGSKSDTFHLSALSPAIYTIQLTMTDTTSGLVGTATTIITVLPAPSEPPSVLNNTSQTTTTTTTTATTTSLQRSSIATHTLTKTATNNDQATPTTTCYYSPTPTTTALAQVQHETEGAVTTDYSLYLKVGVPVLSIVLLILIVSGCIVAASSCVLVQPEKRRYRYRKLVYTDA